MSILVGHYRDTDPRLGFKDIPVNKQKINFLPAADQNCQCDNPVTWIWSIEREIRFGQFLSWLLCLRENIASHCIVIIQRIISNLNSKDKLDQMIFNFWHQEPVVKFIRESDWGCLCDGRYLTAGTDWNVVGDIRYGARAWKISQIASNILLQ